MFHFSPQSLAYTGMVYPTYIPGMPYPSTEWFRLHNGAYDFFVPTGRSGVPVWKPHLWFPAGGFWE